MKGLGFELGFHRPYTAEKFTTSSNEQLPISHQRQQASVIIWSSIFSSHIERAADKMDPLYDMLKGTSSNKKKYETKNDILTWEEKWEKNTRRSVYWFKSRTR